MQIRIARAAVQSKIDRSTGDPAAADARAGENNDDEMDDDEDEKSETS